MKESMIKDKLWGGVAQLAARRLAGRQARVRFSARPHREVFPTEHTSDEDMERGFSEWRRMNVLWLNECMYVIKIKNKQKKKKTNETPGRKKSFKTCNMDSYRANRAPTKYLVEFDYVI
jgi:hypothetical protein